MPAPPTMRAAFFDGIRSLNVRETAVPDPAAGADDVRLRVLACGICGSDLTLYKTGALSGPDVILGHEIVGVVDLDPSGVWAEGTTVCVYPAGRGCGACVWCREGRFRYCVNPPADARGHGGGFAEYLVAPASSLLPVPEGVDALAAALAEPFGVAIRAVELAGATPGDFAYVQGLGPIGLLVVAALTVAGCRVVGSDPRADRRALALEQGAEEAFDPEARDPQAVLWDRDPKGPRLAFECSGVPEALQQVFDACGPGGVVGILGIPLAPAFLLRMTLKELRAFSIQGPTFDSMRLALGVLRERPAVARVATDTVALNGAAEAFEALSSGGGGAKVLVEPDR